MNPRFPTSDVVRMGLPDYTSPSSRMAAEAGAFKGMYEIAQKEFEILRGLAIAALYCNCDAIDALNKYLKEQEGIAETYARDLAQRNRND